jgi:hypothetical protein
MNSGPLRVKTVTRAWAGHCPLSQYSFIRNLRELPFLDSSRVPPGPGEDISELADVDVRQRRHPTNGRDRAIPQLGERRYLSRRTVLTHVVTRLPSRG